MTTQIRLTSDSAIRYVHDYFSKGGEKIYVTSAAHHYDEGDNHSIDIVFVREGCDEQFTVWQQQDGSIYGEW